MLPANVNVLGTTDIGVVLLKVVVNSCPSTEFTCSRPLLNVVCHSGTLGNHVTPRSQINIVHSCTGHLFAPKAQRSLLLSRIRHSQLREERDAALACSHTRRIIVAVDEWPRLKPRGLARLCAFSFGFKQSLLCQAIPRGRVICLEVGSGT